MGTAVANVAGELLSVSHHRLAAQSSCTATMSLLPCRRGKQGQKSSTARLGLAVSLAAVACLICLSVLFTTHNTFR